MQEESCVVVIFLVKGCVEDGGLHKGRNTVIREEQVAGAWFLARGKNNCAPF